VSALAIDTTAGSAASKTASIVFGRFMLPDMTEHACQVLDLSLEGAVFISQFAPSQGTSIVAYLEELGRVEVISDAPVNGGFRIKFVAKGARLERLRQRIEWLQQKTEGAVESRRHPRFEPKDRTSHMTLPDGRVYACEVIDISVSGAGIKTEVLPSIGTYIMLGKMKGRVVRYLETGIGIEFIKHLDKTHIQHHAD
jgi:hypothetical protein